MATTGRRREQVPATPMRRVRRRGSVRRRHRRRRRIRHTPLSPAGWTTTGSAFQAPIQDGVRNIVKQGNVIPVKLLLTNCTGQPVLGRTLSIGYVQGDVYDDADAGRPRACPDSVSNADTTGFMRQVDGKYMYNLATKTMKVNLPYTVVIREPLTNSFVASFVIYPEEDLGARSGRPRDTRSRPKGRLRCFRAPVLHGGRIPAPMTPNGPSTDPRTLRDDLGRGSCPPHAVGDVEVVRDGPETDPASSCTRGLGFPPVGNGRVRGHDPGRRRRDRPRQPGHDRPRCTRARRDDHPDGHLHARLQRRPITRSSARPRRSSPQSYSKPLDGTIVEHRHDRRAGARGLAGRQRDAVRIADADPRRQRPRDRHAQDPDDARHRLPVHDHLQPRRHRAGCPARRAINFSVDVVVEHARRRSASRRRSPPRRRARPAPS